ncbi:MAG: class I adenylate-forming enzyme family protein [Anaerolineae bacterium]
MSSRRRVRASACPLGGGPRQGADPLDAAWARAVVDAAAPHPAWPWPPPPSPPLPRSPALASATTGAPKGAVLTWGNAYANYTASRARLGHGSDDVWLAALPLHHTSAACRSCCGRRGTARRSTSCRASSPTTSRVRSARRGVTIVSLVPSTLRAVLDAWRARYGQRPAPDGLRALLLGGGPLAGAPAAEAAALGFPLAVTYGLTEAASQVATTAPWLAAAGAVGRAAAGRVRVRIAGVGGTGAGGDDADPVDRPIGDEGEIEVAGPTVFAGYWGDPAATARAMDGHWLRTGDLGRLDEDGRLHVVGRLDARIVTGGENVDPAEVEAVLDAHPAIGASCVVGVRDATWGQIVVAVVEPPRPRDVASRPPPSADTRARRADEASPLDAASLRTWLEGRLAGYKRPRRVVVVSSLPRTAAGKVRRAEAARLAQLDLDAADEARDGALREGREPPNAGADEG